MSISVDDGAAPTPPVENGGRPGPAGASVGKRPASFTEARLRTALLLTLALLTGLLILRPGQAAPDEAEARQTMAAEVAMTIGQAQGVSQAAGSYLPGTGFVFYALLAKRPADDAAKWLSATLQPQVAKFAGIAGHTAVLCQLQITGDSSVTTAYRMTVASLADPASWRRTAIAAVAGATPTNAGTAAITSAVPTQTASSSAAPAASASPVPSTTASAAATGHAGPAADDFAKDRGLWNPLAGSWAIAGGIYSQTDESGYDYITQFGTAPPASYTVSVKIRLQSKVLGAGILLGQPTVGSRVGASLIDISGGNYLRWGKYASPAGTYQFSGGAALPTAAAKGDWHILKAIVSNGKATIFWDGVQRGLATGIGAGSLGLVTSVSKADFDDFSVTSP